MQRFHDIDDEDNLAVPQAPQLRRSRNACLVLALVFAIVAFCEHFRVGSFYAEAIEATGRIERATRSSQGFGKNPLYRLTVGFHDSVAGPRSYRWAVNSSRFDQYPPGASIPVWYVPGSPWNSAIIERQTVSYTWVWLLGAATALMFALWWGFELLTTRGRFWRDKQRHQL